MPAKHTAGITLTSIKGGVRYPALPGSVPISRPIFSERPGKDTPMKLAVLRVIVERCSAASPERPFVHRVLNRRSANRTASYRAVGPYSKVETSGKAYSPDKTSDPGL